MATTVLLTVGRVQKPVVLESKQTGGQDRIFFKYAWWPELNEELKASFAGARWMAIPDDKRWSVLDTHHNQFRLKYLMGLNPYARYDKKIPSFDGKEERDDTAEVAAAPQGSAIDGSRPDLTFIRPLMRHQKRGTAHILYRRHCILAAEPGTGKSLMAIEAAERTYQPGDIAIWVAPKTALLSVKMECRKWGCTVPFEFLTYEGFVARVAAWPAGKPAPKILILDEASRVKNADTERAKACRNAADQIREEHGEAAIIVLMSGTPAPQSPVDWFSLVQIACPGFLKEGTEWKFKERLCLTKMMESVTGGTYPKLVTWYDDPSKCKTCGQKVDDIAHTMSYHPELHKFEPSQNEVHNLYKRLNGLVLVILKKDCLDLPEKHFRRINATVPTSILRAAKLIMSRVGTGAKALTLLRELSDGFQYVDYEVGMETCDLCEGKKSIADMAYTGPAITDDFLRSLGLIPEVSQIIDPVLFPQYWEEQWLPCCKCHGSGEIPKMKSQAEYVKSPKDDIFVDLLDEYSGVGRFVTYAAFQGSIDKLVKLVEKEGWHWIKADGRSWKSSMPGNPIGWLTEFQKPNSTFEKIVFIGQPEAAGMGITLTRSPVVVFYSNSTNGESRAQAIERVYRIGSKDHLHTFGGESLRGVMVIDLIGLPSDLRVLTLLDNKRDLQSVTLGELEESFKDAERIE